MKKILKKSFTCGVIFVVLGAVIFMLGFILSGCNLKTINGITAKESTVYETDEDAFEYIKATYENADIKLVFDKNAKKISVTYPDLFDKDGKQLTETVITEIDGRLNIKRTKNWRLNFYTFNFSDNEKITITVPETKVIGLDLDLGNGNFKTEGNGNLKSLTLELDNGSVNTEASKITVEGDFKADLDNGNIHLGCIAAESFELECDNGNLSTNELISKTDVKISLDNGDLKISDKITARSFSAECKNGTIKVADNGITDAENLNIKSDNGTVKLKLSGKKENYNIDIKKDNSNSNIENQSGGSRNLKIDIDNAELNISFE